MTITWLPGCFIIIMGITTETISDAPLQNIWDTGLEMNIHDSNSETDFANSFFMKFNACLENPLCHDMGIISSATMQSSDVWYVTYGRNIAKAAFGADGRCNCTKVFKTPEKISSLVMIGNQLFWLHDADTVNYLSIPFNFSSVPFAKKLNTEMVVEEEVFFKAGCYLPQKPLPAPLIIRRTENTAVFNITHIRRWKDDWLNSQLCHKLLNLKFQFGFYFSNMGHWNESASSLRPTSEFIYQPIFTISSISQTTLKNLQPNYEYLVYVTVAMTSKGQKSLIFSVQTKLATLCEEPLLPDNPRCLGINNTALVVLWDEPFDQEQVTYEIFYKKSEAAKMKSVFISKKLQRFVHNGVRNINVTYVIRLHYTNCTLRPISYSHVTLFDCKPFQDPVTLVAVDSTDHSLSVLWEEPEDKSVKNLFIEWMDISISSSRMWHSSKLLKIHGSFTYVITDLESNTAYRLRTSQQYVGHNGTEGWSTSSAIVRKTMPGVPDFPTNVLVRQSSSRIIISWSLPRDNGSPLLGYYIWCRNETSKAAFGGYGDWWLHVIVSDNKAVSWGLEQLESGLWYEFRVSARNQVGEGDRSPPSNLIFYHKEIEVSDSYEAIGISAGALVFLVSMVAAILVWRCQYQKYGHTDSTAEATDVNVDDNPRTGDSQNSSVAHVNETSASSNLLPPSNLPLVPREKLELLEFLGKGAFGEVYAGVAYDVGEDPGSSTRVAVKLLRENSGQKKEFLMEANVMSKFDHKNILSLLGVCWESQHQYLVMELMEGGDLSHYLRDAKPTAITLAKLSTLDLIDICLDIAAGCRYLEEQHFIHRDLAARNCLVSTKDYSSDSRVVKIGDFGLARDIYRSEYYHKHGEGLLPIRWMAPESLEENLYTTQSDVWAFGILLWEVMSYGRRPYQILTDIEVLPFIKAGGRMEKPDNCPEQIYLLMTKCWLSAPTFRPSFAWTLEFLHNVKDACDGMCDSDSDMVPGNYMTATTSDEDFADEGIRESRSSSLDSRGRHNEAFDSDEDSGSDMNSPQHRVEDTRDLTTPDKHPAVDQNEPSQENIPANSNMPAPPMSSSLLLPYIGDLPITDEERLLRKKQWNEQVSNSTQQ